MSLENNELRHFDAEIEKLFEKIAEDEELQEYKIRKAGGGLKGDGYLGVITAIELSGICGSDKKTLNLVVKSASKSDALRTDTPIADVYQREIYMYNTVLPALKRFQTDKGLPAMCSFAKCYKATIIDKSEALVLENLKTIGFELWDRRIPMNEDHVALVMCEYGRFHSMSYALKDQEPKEFNRLTKSMFDVFAKFMVKTNFDQLLIDQCLKASKILHPEEDADALITFKSFLGTAKKFIANLPQLVDEYSVILHGDCWTNNMLFKYDNLKYTKKPTNVCLIDLQIARLGPPVLDLAYFFYACSSKEIISNYQHYLDIYYSSVSDCLKKLGSDPNKVYPRSVFHRQWRESARYGLLMSVLVIKIMMSEQNEVCDLADAADSGKGIADAFAYDIANSDVYNDRVRHMILHFVNNRFI